jgi:hypothetical protein
LIGKTDSVSHAQRRFSEIRSALSKIFAKTVRQAASSSGLMSLMSESRIANCVLNLIDPLHQGLGSGREFNDPGPAIMLGCPAQNQAVGFQIAQHASQRGLLDTHAFRQLRLIDPVPNTVIQYNVPHRTWLWSTVRRASFMTLRQRRATKVRP